MKKVINYVANKKEWEEAQTKEFNKLNKKVKFDGFRPGKAPRAMVEKKYGADILIDAANSLIDKEYRRILFEDKIIPILDPKIELVKSSKEELEVNFTLITEPEVKLGKYKDLGIKKDAVKVSKEEIKDRIDATLKEYAELVIKDSGRVEKGDIAIIDYEGFKDGVAFDGGKGENYSLEIGSNTFIPGFEDGIIGMQKDEEKDLKLTFPEDYGVDELNGQEVVFKVKVNEIKRRELPELDKDFFDDLGLEDINTKEEYEAKIKDDIKKEKERKAENDYVDKLFAKAVSNMECEIDDEIVEAEANEMYKNMIDRMQAQGIEEDLYLKYADTTKEDIISHLKENALKRLQNSYLLQAIIKEEKIEVSDKELEEEVNGIATEYNITKEEVIKELGGKENIRYDLMIRKAIDILKGNE